jgi:hypothetical protein
MSAQAIAQPANPFRTRSAVLAAAALAVVLLAVSAGIAALVSDGASSGTAPAATPPAAVASVDTCPGDAGALLTVVAGLPVAEHTPIMRSLSPDTAAMIRTAAESSALTNTLADAPDPSTLAGVLSRISPSDSAVILRGLAPQTRAAVQAASPRVCG